MKLEIHSNTFKALLKVTPTKTSHIREYLNGVCLRPCGDHWKAIATDGGTLLVIKIDQPSGEADKEIIIHVSTCKMIAGLRNPLIIDTDENYIQSQSNDNICFRPLDCTYPDIGRVIQAARKSCNVNNKSSNHYDPQILKNLQDALRIYTGIKSAIFSTRHNEHEDGVAYLVQENIAACVMPFRDETIKHDFDDSWVQL